ncbi:MAG: hypothetical protein LBE13_09940 [Bacteroidales bacterium]|nr:hypothetical protein [Bacteroidales bacterium]
MVRNLFQPLLRQFIEERIYDYDRRPSNGEINTAKTVKRTLSKKDEYLQLRDKQDLLNEVVRIRTNINAKSIRSLIGICIS